MRGGSLSNIKSEMDFKNQAVATSRLTKTAPTMILDIMGRTAKVEDLLDTLIALSRVNFFIIRSRLETQPEVVIPDFCIPKHASKCTLFCLTSLQAGRTVRVTVLAFASINTQSRLATRILKAAAVLAVHNLIVTTIGDGYLLPTVDGYLLHGHLLQVNARNSVARVIQSIVDGHQNVTRILTARGHWIRIGVYTRISQIVQPVE